MGSSAAMSVWDMLGQVPKRYTMFDKIEQKEEELAL